MSQQTDRAASILGTAASASAAIPVAGPFVAAGLGVASMFTKIFGNIDGPRKKRNRRRREAEARMQQHNQGLRDQLGYQQGAGGFLNTGGNMPSQGAPAATNQMPQQGYFYGGNQ